MSEAAQLVDKGTLLLRWGELEAARAAFQVANELMPSAASLDGLGCVAFRTGDMVLAEEAFKRALALDPHYENARANLAFLYEMTGYSKEAGVHYEEALRGAPNDMALRNNFAAYLFDRGESPTRVREELLRAGVIEPHPIVVSNSDMLDSVEDNHE